MTGLSTFTFFALIEAILVLTLISGFLAWRVQQLRTGQTRIQYIDAADDYPTPTLYLDREASRTRSFVEDLRAKPATLPVEPGLRAALNVRAVLLKQESLMAAKSVAEREGGDWSAIAGHLFTIFKGEGFDRCDEKSMKVYGEDTPATDSIIVQQTQTIEHLREYVHQLLEKLGHTPLPDNSVLERFDMVERVNRELNQCIAVLEDENSFLRDQIATLLKLDSEHAGN